MARRRYYRRFVRVAPKKKWASNMKLSVITTSSPAITLVENATQSNAPTPVILKTGNFKVQGDMKASVASTSGQSAGAALFVAFVPEGTFASTPSLADISTFISRHPEYIMAWTMVDLSVTSTSAAVNGSKFSITSRLKRNLNSGDKIMLLLRQALGAVSVEADLVAQYFTCSN